jgi:hypothetical protein
LKESDPPAIVEDARKAEEIFKNFLRFNEFGFMVLPVSGSRNFDRFQPGRPPSR